MAGPGLRKTGEPEGGVLEGRGGPGGERSGLEVVLEQSGCGPGGRRSGWTPKISRFFFFFHSRPLFVFFFQFPRSFVELRWSLRDFILENVFTTQFWSVAEGSRGGAVLQRGRPAKQKMEK